MDPNIYALVLDTLNRATSQDTEVLKPAEKKLQEWEIEPGFYSVLLDVLSNHSIDINVRWLAVMCFKNGVDRYWRRNAPNAITDDEKQKLRLGLLTTNILSEPVTQIATQQAVLISKIARFDCPTNWPNLVPDLIGALKAPQPLVQHRSLLIFHHLVKALASKRMIGDRRIFQELTNSVYAFILNLWHENTEVFLRNIQEGAATELITEHLEKALLCLRILRKLTVFGFKKAHESQDAVAFLNVVFDRAKTSLECRKLLKGRGIYPLELCEKFIIHLTKVALGVLSFHPFSYVPLIRPSLQFALYYCFTEQGMTLGYERFTIQCLNIVKGVLLCAEYKLPKGTEPVKEPLTLEAHQAKMEVLDPNTVCHMCRHLVSHYFVLSADDLALWDAEPESFATDEAGESWKYSLRTHNMDPNIYALVLDTLNRATSQDTEVLKPAEKKLQEWEIEPGFYSVLLDVLSNHSIDINVRWLAVMCFKNGVDRYWRRNAPNAITEDEKQKLRLGLLTTNILSEPVTQIATQQAVLISKIARFDCPTNWPNLVPDLIGALKAPQPLVQHRSLLIFHHLVKALASKRMIGDRRIFQELTNSVYAFILNLWHENTEVFLRNIQEGAATELITEHLEKALLCLRILRKLTVFGFKKAHESQDAVAFLNVVFDRAKTSLECRKLLKGRGIYPLELCEKFIIHLTKVALGVLSFHPFSYVPLIRPSLQFALYYCFTEQGMTLGYERFTIQCLNIVKGVLLCAEYKLPKGTEPVKEPLTLEAHQAKMEVLDPNTVCHMCRHLVSHYFVLSADDLALWDAEPESFATDEAGESWKYSLRMSQDGVLDPSTVCHMCRHLVSHYFVLSADDLALWDAEPESFVTDEAGESWKYSLRMSQDGVLDPSTVCHMCRHLVSHYFVLSADDLALWDAEPESFVTDEAGESWKYSLRPCTEALFMELFQFRNVLAPELVRLLASLQQQQISPDDLPAILKTDAIYNAVGLAAFDLYDDQQISPDDLPAILKTDAIYNAVGLAAFDLYDDLRITSSIVPVLAPQLVRLLASLQQQQISPDDLPAILKTDAIYNAVGLAAFDLYDDVDFDEWFTNVLSQELKIKDNNYRIIRRRVCQLIGQWCGVRASQSLRPAMYEALLEPLSRPDEDAAVKLAAAEALRSTIDDFNFDVKQFAPYAPHAIAALYELLVESEECDTKMHVLHVVSYIMERCGAHVARGGGTGALFAYLPQLWGHAASAHHNMLRAAALAAIHHLLKALGECSPTIRPWILSVVNESTKLSEPAHVYLLEDALELWLAILETSQVADPPLLQLADNLYPILEQSSEHLRIVVYIMQAYTLLCPEEFLLGPGGKCMALLDELLADMRTEGVITVLKMAEICISVTFPERNAFLGVKVIWPILIRVIHLLLDTNDLPMVLSVQLCLVSRVILLSSELFYKAIQEASVGLVEYDSDPAKVLARFLHVWTDKMNLVTQVERWKVVGLGLAALLTTQNPTVLQRFPAILLNLTEVLNDVMKTEDNGTYVDGLVAPPGSRPASPLEGRGGAARWGQAPPPDSPHELRRRRLAAAHPAHAIDLRAVTHHQ
ncbi:importin-11, partial [Ostrinia furnacalis]|uniref:importin-11 n=1 Tax=Ostrinia furnacalis TaxID=93504 RepID=UPI00103D9461